MLSPKYVDPKAPIKGGKNRCYLLAELAKLEAGEVGLFFGDFRGRCPNSSP
jgi:hypothetical protein